jgi:WXG100 family type VII secretion target
MLAVAAELERVYADMVKQMNSLDSNMEGVGKIWKGEAATAYNKAYVSNKQSFTQLCQSIKSCSETLKTITNTYTQADNAAADAIRQKMAKG